MVSKTHGKIFGGFLGIFSPIPSSTSIIRNEILPSMRGILESISFGRILYFALLLIITISSIIWIKEVFDNIDKTSRFMTRSEWNLFLIKCFGFAIFGILTGLIVGDFIP